MLKKILVWLCVLALGVNVCFAQGMVNAVLPQTLDGITSVEMNDKWCTEKDGYATMGWYIEAETEDDFFAFIENYSVELQQQGYTLTETVRPKNLNAVYYFYDHPDESLTAAQMNGIPFDLYLYAEAGAKSKAIMMGYVTGIELTEEVPVEDEWASILDEEEVAEEPAPAQEDEWDSVLNEEEADVAAAPIPDFAAFAKDAIISSEAVDGRTVYTIGYDNLSCFQKYVELLETYGVSGMDGGDEKFGLPLFTWLEDWDREPELEDTREDITLLGGEEGVMRGYVFFSLMPDGQNVKMTVWYGNGVTTADTGERWNGEPDAMLGVSFKKTLQEMELLHTPYTFANEAVGADVAHKLNKNVEDIVLGDLYFVRNLGVLLTTSNDLSDLQYLTELDSFSLSPLDEGVYDLSVLEASPYLNRVYLLNGAYENLDSLGDLEYLKEIELHAESITDISWMKNNERAEFVSISDCSITDFTALKELPELEQVYLEIKLSDDVSFLYGKGLQFGEKNGSPTSTFDAWYEHNWGKPGEEKPAEQTPAGDGGASADEKTPVKPGEVAIPSFEEAIGDVTLKSKSEGDLVTSYTYDYRYGTSCYKIMQMYVDDMINSGFYQMVDCYDSADMRFWEMQYVGGGSMEPIGQTSEGEPYHVRVSCYSAYISVSFTYISGMFIYRNSNITYGEDFRAPEPEVFSSEGALVTVRDFATFMGGTRLLKAERRADNSSYYQYLYNYGDSVYSMISMYADDLKRTGLFETADFVRSGVACFYYLKYIGPGAENLKPLGFSEGGEYHVQLGCANYNYMSDTFSGLNFISIHLGDKIALDDSTWAEGYTPGEPGELEPVSGFTVKFRTVERTCPTCHGSGKCNLCNGSGTYRQFGVAVDCPTVCSFCKGEKTYEAMEAYYEPN